MGRLGKVKTLSLAASGEDLLPYPGTVPVQIPFNFPCSPAYSSPAPSLPAPPRSVRGVDGL